MAVVTSAGRPREITLIGVGGALLGASPFLPWIHVVLLGDVNLLQLIDLGHGSPVAGYAVSVAGVGVALAAALGLSWTALRTLSITVAVLVGLLGGDYSLGLFRAVQDSKGLASAGIGVAFAVLAVILLIVPAVLLREATGMHPSSAAGDRASWPPQTGWDQYVPPPSPPAWQSAVGAGLLGVLCALGLVLIPAGGGGHSCGSPLAALTDSPLPLPTDVQPTQDPQVIAADQDAVTRAKAALDSAAKVEAAAQILSGQAQDAQSNAAGLFGQISGDQATIDGDGNTIVGDNNTIQADQQTIQQDRAQGSPTDSDQATLVQDQATLAQDQATLEHDKGVLLTDQQAAAAASSSSQKLTTQSAQASAGSPSSSDMQTRLDSAQQQLQQDQQAQQNAIDAWQAQHDRRLSYVEGHNRALADCQGQAQPRVILAAVVLLGGLAFAAVQLTRRRRQAIRRRP